MMSFIEECTSKLREKVPFYLISGEPQLLNNDSKYPFGTKQVPIMCNFAEEEPEKSLSLPKQLSLNSLFA